MAFEEKDIVIKSGHKIKVSSYTGDFEDFYKECYRWFIHYGYKWKELKFINIEKPNGSKQVEIWWECTREIEDYYTFVIELQFQCMFSDIEVQMQTGKKKLQKGSIELRSGAYILKNIKVWENPLFGKILGKMYEIMTKQKLDKLEDELYIEVHKLYNEIRTYFGIA